MNHGGTRRPAQQEPVRDHGDSECCHQRGQHPESTAAQLPRACGAASFQLGASERRGGRFHAGAVRSGAGVVSGAAPSCKADENDQGER